VVCYYLKMQEMGIITNPASSYEQFDEEHEKKEQVTSKKIHEQLGILRRKIVWSDLDLYIEGFLFKQRKFGTGWKKKWAVFRNDGSGNNCIFYYKNRNDVTGTSLLGKLKGQEDPNAQGVIPITFVALSKFTTHERELLAVSLEGQQSEFSESCLKVFSRGRIYSFCAGCEEDLLGWYEPIADVLQDSLGPQFHDKQQAAEILIPLLRLKYYEYLAEAQILLENLEKQGFFVAEDKIKSKNRDKQANLYMMYGNNNSWTRYRVVLKGPYIYYYLPEKGHQSARTIVLRYSSIEGMDVEEADGSAVFCIHTPILSYYFKCKHRVAMEEWVDAIERGKSNSGLKKGVKIPTKEIDMKVAERKDEEELLLTKEEKSRKRKENRSRTIDPLSDGPFLTYHPPGRRPTKKPKVFKITTTVTSIGRADTNDLVIDDTRMSREHCRLDTIDNKLVFVDLGSKRGSKINHHMVKERQVLHPGDKIKIGRTFMRVWVA